MIPIAAATNNEQSTVVFFIRSFCIVISIPFASPGSSGLRSRKLIEIGLHHTVINLPVLICSSADRLLRLLIGSDQIHGPAVKHTVPLAYRAIQPWKILPVLQPLTIRRVRNNETIFLRVAQLLYAPALKVDHLFHACQSGVSPGNGHHLVVDIISLDVRLYIQIDQ